MLAKDALEQLGTVVVGDAKVARTSFGHELLRSLEDALALIHLVVCRVYGMGQQQIEVLHAAGIELLLEHLADGRGIAERAVSELVHEEEALARMTLYEALAQCDLGLAAKVDVRGVKVVEPRLEEAVEHLVAKLEVGLATPHWQAHGPKAEASLELTGRKCHLRFLPKDQQ